MQVEENPILVENEKKIRRRKKNLYKSILQQMEFYFSDANIRKNRFISQLIAKNPFVELSTFLNFYKIAALTNKTEEIATALEKSMLLELSEDKTKVCRITPVKEKLNEDDCTIYVERLPEDTQHDWLKEIFSSFGTVDYVSLPKYKHNKRHKGFAFIEFSEPDNAQKALSYFESIGCKLPTQMPPNQLVSIITFEPEVKNDQKLDALDIESSEPTCEEDDKKIILEKTEDISSKEDDNPRKRKSPDDEESQEKTKKMKTEDDVEGNDENQDDTKKKRKRKKNKKSPFDFRQIGLQVLSKREWKQLRNKYLNMQRQKMKTLKEHLYKNRHYNTDCHNENFCAKKSEKMDPDKDSKSEPRFKFLPGCIIKFTIPEECNDSKKLKNDIKQKSGVEFVDVHPNKTIGYVRFANKESTDRFKESSFLESMDILEGNEETEYWDKIFKDRESKLKKAPAKKIRGREKLLKKAEQELGKHIRFE